VRAGKERKGRTVDTRERILKAATEVFVEKGLAGARMQEIADCAQVNKAMLHYYFTSKEHLYETTVVTAMSGVMTRVQKVLAMKGVPAEAHLRKVIETYLDSLAEHPYIPRLVMQDLMTGGTRITDYFEKAGEQAGFLGGKPAVEMLRKFIASGDLRQVDPKQTIISLVSMVVLYFAAQPIFSRLLELDDRDRERFLAERKRNVRDIFLHGVLAQKGNDHAQGGHGNA